jgi:O-antigen/teichoic acid export membrane protein
MTWMDVIIIGFFLPPDQVSIYSIASKIAKLMTFPLFAINTIIAPRISAHFSKGDTRSLNSVSQKSTLLAIGFSLPLFLVFMVFPTFFMGIFGSAYVGGSNVLRILVTGQVINCFTGAVIVILTMMKLEKKVNVIAAIGLSLQVFLGIILTPKYGMIGMAIATFIGTAVLNISGFLILYISHGVNTFPSWSLIRNLGKKLDD